jgi:hypothetical protein
MNEEILSSSSLPYGVKVQKEGESTKDHDNTIANKKKRIEAIIPSEKTDSVLTTLF